MNNTNQSTENITAPKQHTFKFKMMYLRELDGKRGVVLILLDLSAAFVTIDHFILFKRFVRLFVCFVLFFFFLFCFVLFCFVFLSFNVEGSALK